MNRIYLLVDPRDLAIRYVGVTVKSIDFRRRAHISRARCGDRCHRSDWIRSLLAVGLEPQVVLLEETEDRDRECYWIAYYRSTGMRLTNGTDGGDGALGYRHSAETRQKMSAAWEGRDPLPPEVQRRSAEARRGRKMSQETREKLRPHWDRVIPPSHQTPHTEDTKRRISEAKKGKALSDEHRKKLSESHRGRVFDEETRRKIAQSNTGKHHSEATREKIKKSWEKRRGL